MDFQELILTRRTVHNYKAQPVDSGLVEEALKLSLWAPNHRLTFPWKYFWLGESARARLADLAVELKSQKGPLSAVKSEAVRASVLNPSHIILTGIVRSKSDFQEHEDYATLASSLMIASLYLWHQGVATKWSTGGWTLNDRTYQICGVDPEQVRLEGALLVGIPQVVPSAPERPELDQVLVRVD